MDYTHPVVKHFFECSREAAYHYKISTDETKIPAAIEAKYFRSLNEYRKYLDSIGMPMSRAKYYYDPHDQTTHAFIDVLIKTHKQFGKFYIKAIPNPRWKHRERYEKECS